MEAADLPGGKSPFVDKQTTKFEDLEVSKAGFEVRARRAEGGVEKGWANVFSRTALGRSRLADRGANDGLGGEEERWWCCFPKAQPDKHLSHAKRAR